MGTFGADVGAIWRSDLDTASKSVLTAIRYHGGDDGACRCTLAQVAARASMHRATVIERIAAMVGSGRLVVERTGRGSTYQVVMSSTATSEVVPGDGSSTATGRPRRPLMSSTATSEVVPGDLSPTPPNREFQISPDLSSLSESDSAQARPGAAATRRPDPRDTTPPGPVGVESADGDPHGSGETPLAHVPPGVAVHPVPAGLAEVVEAWRGTQRSGRGGIPLVVPPAEVDALRRLTVEHGPERAVWAIGRAVEVKTTASPSLRLVGELAAEGPQSDRPRSRDRPRQQSHADSGVYERHGVQRPKARSTTWTSN